MNNRPHSQTVSLVAVETIEKLALMFLVPEEEMSDGAPQAERAVSVAFSGVRQGVLFLSADKGILPELAANMLGYEDGSQVPADQQDDALRELANVMCGNLLPAIAGPKPVFHISAPQDVPESRAPDVFCGSPPAGVARLCVDSGAIEIRLFIDEPVTVRAAQVSL